MNGVYFGLILLLGILATEAEICRFVAPQGLKHEIEQPLKRDAIGNENYATIGIYWNMITDDDGVNGFLNSTQVTSVIDLLNVAFNGTGINFALIGDVRVIKNDSLFTVDTEDVDAFSFFAQYHQGNTSTLNLYTSNWLLDDYPFLGTTILPKGLFGGNAERRDQFDALDMIYVNYRTLLGSASSSDIIEIQRHHDGKQLVHQVGHWLGLLHPSDGGCHGSDYVQDTPAQAHPYSDAASCDDYVDTCPSDHGLDDISNFMDESNDDCVDHFTNGQALRMYNVWNLYRNVPSTISNATSAVCTAANSGYLTEYVLGGDALAPGAQSVQNSDSFYSDSGRFYFNQYSQYFSTKIVFVVATDLPIGTEYTSAHFQARSILESEAFPTNNAQQLNFEQFKYDAYGTQVITVDTRYLSLSILQQYQENPAFNNTLLPEKNPLFGLVTFFPTTDGGDLDMFPLNSTFHFSLVVTATEPNGKVHRLWAKGVEFQHYIGSSAHISNQQNNLANRCRGNNGFVVYASCNPSDLQEPYLMV